MDFVGDEDDAVLVANGTQFAKELRRRNHEATFAQDWFDDDGGDGFRSDVAAEEFVEGLRAAIDFALGVGLAIRAAVTVGVRYAVNLAGEGLEAGFIRMCLAGERNAE